ncbi:unnamed protein product [Symbiodinium sp. CCMP2592]|nr:unnamed protein product [Symbiodinium sp. CCMP2592]
MAWCGHGISLDKFDAVLHKVAGERGVWVVARLVGIGRVVLGSVHCHTGVTTAVYQAAAHEFCKLCPRKYRHLPVICGADANEQTLWEEPAVPGRHKIGSCSSNLNVLIHDLLQNGIEAVAPAQPHLLTPTHYPRDESREGRQIDMVFTRLVHVTPLSVDPERRHIIGSDHAIILGDILVQGGPSSMKWGNDSRARWVCRDIPETEIIDEDDLIEIAKKYTRPRPSYKYRDSDEVKDCIARARESNLPRDWKTVHRCRRQARKKWSEERLSAIVKGDWDQYRLLQNEKKRKRGWWGSLLENCGSTDLAADITAHLENKMKNPHRSAEEWESQLGELIESCTGGDFQPFSLLDVRTELQGMKCRSAVGPDGIGVHLLRELASDEIHGPRLLSLINHIVKTRQLPNSWETSFLALLAKVSFPKGPGDLRPICVSSAFHKLINRLVCSRALPVMRRGSKISCCGKGRQAADLLGTVSRLRDVTKEWRHPLLLCKLDVAGAFDKIDRAKVADLLVRRLQHKGVNFELRYLLAQLTVHRLVGNAPGGRLVCLSRDDGIKQGAPESAELFGLVVDAMLSELVHCRQWQNLGAPLDDCDIDLLFYQDDVFLIETAFGRLCKRITVVDRCLQGAGLHLAAAKTKIVANDHYHGARSARIGDQHFKIADKGESLKVLGISFSLAHDASEQAKELISRTRAAAAEHRDILQAPGPWSGKIAIIRTLVEAQFNWTAGAFYWGKDDLHGLNVYLAPVLQCELFNGAALLGGAINNLSVDWSTARDKYIAEWDTKWTRGRQLSLSISASALDAFGNFETPLLLPFVLMALRCGLALGWLLSVPLWVAGAPGDDDPQEHRPYWRSWTPEEIAEYTAAAWEEDHWYSPASPSWNTSSLTTWDEEISLALQDDLLQHEYPLVDNGLAPIPEDIPLPFGGEPVEEDSYALPWSGVTCWPSSSSDMASGTQGSSSSQQSVASSSTNNEGDWLDKVLDTRGLRGRSVPLGRDPATLLHRPGEPRCDGDDHAPDNTPLIGMTSRGGRARGGVDRWHHPDGSVRSRLRERMEEEERAASHGGIVDDADDADDHGVNDSTGSTPFQVVGVDFHNDEPTIKAITFYGDRFQVRAGGTSRGSTNTSTTAGSSNTETDDSEAGPSSSSSSSQQHPGFWRHGIWHNRPRSDAELRAHRGGMGPRRLARKAARVNSYLDGTWRPAWLQEYVKEKKARDAQRTTSRSYDVLADMDAKALATFLGKPVPEAPGLLPTPSPNTNLTSAQTQESNTATDVDPWAQQPWQNGWWDHHSTSQPWDGDRDDNQWTGGTWTGQEWSQWEWGDSSWRWSSWSSSTSTTTTSSSTLPSLPPNAGLLPDVRTADNDDVVLMQMTGAERASLQEVDSIEQLLEALDRENDRDNGPEARHCISFSFVDSRLVATFPYSASQVSSSLATNCLTGFGATCLSLLNIWNATCELDYNQTTVVLKLDKHFLLRLSLKGKPLLARPRLASRLVLVRGLNPVRAAVLISLVAPGPEVVHEKWHYDYFFNGLLDDLFDMDDSASYLDKLDKKWHYDYFLNDLFDDLFELVVFVFYPTKLLTFGLDGTLSLAFDGAVGIIMLVNYTIRWGSLCLVDFGLQKTTRVVMSRWIKTWGMELGRQMFVVVHLPVILVMFVLGLLLGIWEVFVESVGWFLGCKEPDEEPEKPTPDPMEETPPKAELTEEEKAVIFRPFEAPDVSDWILVQALADMTLPEKTEGFENVSYMWSARGKAETYFKEWKLTKKLTTRIEDLVVGEWFNQRMNAWKDPWSVWRQKQSTWKAGGGKKEETPKAPEVPTEEAPAEEAKLAETKDEPMTTGVADEDLDVFGVADVLDVGNGEPLCSLFAPEDWILLTLRVELHHMAYSFRKDVTDADLPGMHVDTIPFYYNRYLRKNFAASHYGCDTNQKVIELVKDTVSLNDKKVLVPELSEDLDNFDIFLKLTEDCRRERQLNIDLGEQSAVLKFKHSALLPSGSGQKGYGQKGPIKGYADPKGGKGKPGPGGWPMQGYDGKGFGGCWGGGKGGCMGPGGGGKGGMPPGKGKYNSNFGKGYKCSQPLLLGSPVKRAAPRRPLRGEVRQSCTCRRRHLRKASCAETLRRINSKLWAQKVMEGAISSEIRSFLSKNRQVTSLPELREALNQSPEARRRPAQVFDAAADEEAAASAVATSPMEEAVELPPAETTQPEEAAVTTAASSDAAMQLAEDTALPDAAMEPATEAEDATQPDEDTTVPDAAMEPVTEAEDATQPDEASPEPSRSSDREAETLEKAPAPLELLTCS